MVSPNVEAVSGDTTSLYLSEASELADLAYGFGFIKDGIVFPHDDKTLTSFWDAVKTRLADKPEHEGFVEEYDESLANHGPQTLNSYYQGVKRMNWVNTVLEREGVGPQPVR